MSGFSSARLAPLAFALAAGMLLGGPGASRADEKTPTQSTATKAIHDADKSHSSAPDSAVTSKFETFDVPAEASLADLGGLYADHVLPTLRTYCGDCHDPSDTSSHAIGFLADPTVEAVGQHRGLWRSVAEQLRNRTMPPADALQPSEAERLALATWIEIALRKTAALSAPYAGVIPPRRLNRTEYNHTVRDLIGLDLRPADQFPADGSGGEGFDNNGETLFLPPLLMERYLEAATAIVDRAILTPPIDQTITSAEATIVRATASSAARTAKPQPEKSPASDPLSAGDVIATPLRVYRTSDLTVTFTGEIRWPATKAAAADATRNDKSKSNDKPKPNDKPESQTKPSSKRTLTLEVLVDGLAADRFEIAVPVHVTQHKLDAKTIVHLNRGDHEIAVRVVGEGAVTISSIRIVEKRNRQPTDAERAVHLRLTGIASDQTPEDPTTTARAALTTFAGRAFRRPASPADLDRLMALFAKASHRGDPFAEAIKLPLRAVLIHPRFLFRVEAEPKSSDLEPLEGYELASRLSYFLWTTMPDDQLLAAAASGRLTDEDELARQVDRMLDDPRAADFAQVFASQWLGTSEVGARVAPAVEIYANFFTNNLLDDMRDEPGHFFEHLLREDGNLLDLIGSDYVVVNDRLAIHYGFTRPPTTVTDELPESFVKADRWDGDDLPEPLLAWRTKEFKKKEGGPWRVVSLPDERRGGVLGMASVHMATSYADRTSPVLRGGWVLETLLGVTVPNPPPDVPQLKRNRKEPKSVREQLAIHREVATCAACHNLIDPPGFALDNFDVLGRWRTKDGNTPVDASATLPSGETFTGPSGLRDLLATRREEFLRHLTTKLLGFALGRSLTDRDAATAEQIAASLDAESPSARDLVRRVVMSVPFRMRQRPTESVAVSTSAVDEGAIAP